MILHVLLCKIRLIHVSSVYLSISFSVIVHTRRCHVRTKKCHSTVSIIGNGKQKSTTFHTSAQKHDRN